MPFFLDDQPRPASFAHALSRGTAVVVGNFDGVHLGHQRLFTDAVALAAARGLVPVALTFDPHPSVALGRTPPGPLTTLARKVELIERLGVPRVFVRRFDRAFASWSPERFVEELVARDLFARVVVCGKNFRFGKDRGGDGALLDRLGARLGFEAMTAEAIDAKGPLSSTRARDAVTSGDLDEAARVLGRAHAIEGRVVRGEARGRTIGFPTANVAPETLLPPRGVYAVRVERVRGADANEGASHGAEVLAAGVMNIGVRPTVSDRDALSVEAHLLDFDGDLYGATLRVHLVTKLRDEQKFASLDALKAQIALDAARAREATA